MIRNLWSRWIVISLATLLYWTAHHALRPYLALRLEALGADDFTVGIAVASYGVAALVLAIPSGRFLDRSSTRPVLVVAFIGMAAVDVGLAVSSRVWQVAVLLLVCGVFTFATWLALQTMISHVGAMPELQRHLTIFSLCWGIGMAVGPIVGGVVYDTAGFATLCLLFSLLSAAGAAIALLGPRVRGAASPSGGPAEVSSGIVSDVRRTAGNPAIFAVLASSFLSMFVVSIQTSFYPLFLERAGYQAAQIGVLMSVIGTASLLVRAPLPYLERRFGSVAMLMAGLGAAIVGIGATPFLSHYAALAVAAMLLGAAMGINPTITVNLIARHAEPDTRGLAVSLRMVSNRASQVVQPLVFGGAASIVGLGMTFPLASVLLGVVAVSAARRLRGALAA